MKAFTFECKKHVPINSRHDKEREKNTVSLRKFCSWVIFHIVSQAAFNLGPLAGSYAELNPSVNFIPQDIQISIHYQRKYWTKSCLSAKKTAELGLSLCNTQDKLRHNSTENDTTIHVKDRILFVSWNEKQMHQK